MKIHVLTAIWKRPEITDIFLKGVDRLGFDCTAVVSEDIDLPCDTVYAQNNPLGKKWNTGLKHSLKKEWDYLLILGSDDLISDCLIDRYMSYSDWDMIGVKDFYMYDIATGRVKYFEGYEKNQSIGAGRLIKRKVVENCRKLFSDRRNKGLDGQCSLKLRRKGFKEVVVPMNESVVVDIKSPVNMNSFDKINGIEVDKSVLKKIPEL